MRKIKNWGICVLSLLGLFIANPAFAQQEVIKWGKIADGDLLMTNYAADTLCEAVILSDVGHISMKLVDGLKYSFRHHRRIKILDSLAFREGNISIPYFSDENREKITQLKAQIIQPDGSRQSLGRKEIFDEPVHERWSMKRILYTNMQVGSIIEYRYEILSDRIHTLRDWFFQTHLPVRYSELRVDIPQYYDYVKFLQTNQKAISIESTKSSVVMETEDQNTIENDTKVYIETNRYVMENVPAMRPAPFITTMNDYRACLRFELSKVSYPSGREERFLPSWHELAQQLKKASDFGAQYSKAENYRTIENAASNILKEKLSAKEKLQRLYHFINEQMQWNGRYSAFAENDLSSAWTSKKASSGTINLMLLALLQEAKIKAYPLLISTRAHGKPVQQYPILSQFNHCLVYAIIDNTPILLDAGNKMRPPGLVRMESMNGYGWLLGSKSEEWIEIEGEKHTENYLIIGKLDSDGQLKGRMEGSFRGTVAVELRREYTNATDTDYWEELLSAQHPKVTIDSSTAIHVSNPAVTLEAAFQFRIDSAAQKIDTRLYLRPVLLSRYFKPLLTAEVRRYPVDIPYPIKEQFVLLLDIPEGYAVESLPEGLRVLIYDNGGDFNYLLSQKENQLKLISRINIRKTRYSPEAYDDIKEFFEQIAAKFAEPIVLKKLEK